MDIFRDSLVIDSPRVLARYSLTTALETMRKKTPKVVHKTADNTNSR
jgi:antitoxin component of MazEF toxin-antitoxin module